MDNPYGFSNSKVPRHSSQPPTPNFALQNPYRHHLGHVVDPYLSHNAHTIALQNLNSPNLRYLQPARSHLAPPSPVLERQHPVSYMYPHSSSNRSIESRMESPRQYRSPFQFSNTVKAEEDVVVIDGVAVNDLPADRSRSSSLSLQDSGGSSSSGGKNRKPDLCLSYLDNSGFCRYGSKCQFAHIKQETQPVPLSYKSALETCKSYNSRTCAFGSKCRFLHQELSKPTSSTSQTISQIKPDEPTSSIVNLKSRNWSPMDDDIKIQLEQDFETYINGLLHGPIRIKRLPVFSQGWPE